MIKGTIVAGAGLPHTVDVRVELNSSQQLKFVNLNEVSIRETRVRVLSALASCGIELEQGLTVTLGEPCKNSGGLDLAVAVAIAVATGRMLAPTEPTLYFGELGLDGGLRSTLGTFAAVELGSMPAVVPAADRNWFNYSTRQVRTASTLADVIAGRGQAVRTAEYAPVFSAGVDLSEIVGNKQAVTALEVAVSGGHNLLLVGSNGTWQSSVARRAATILPGMTVAQARGLSMLYSMSGLVDGLVRERPFRAPHHTVSHAGLIGGGDPVRPGEVSLAHGGILYLDEIQEFRRDVMGSLLSTLNAGIVRVHRGILQTEYPAQPLVIGAMPGYCINPHCLGDGVGRCPCFQQRIAKFKASVEFKYILAEVKTPYGNDHAETSEVVRARVTATRKIQTDRAVELGLSRVLNAHLSPTAVAALKKLQPSGLKFDSCSEHQFLVARTIADMRASAIVEVADMDAASTMTQ